MFGCADRHLHAVRTSATPAVLESISFPLQRHIWTRHRDSRLRLGGASTDAPGRSSIQKALSLPRCKTRHEHSLYVAPGYETPALASSANSNVRRCSCTMLEHRVHSDLCQPSTSAPATLLQRYQPLECCWRRCRRKKCRRRHRQLNGLPRRCQRDCHS